MIVASLASLHTRAKLLERTVASLLPQVDALCVYLNGYRQVPACLLKPKVLHAVLSDDAGWRGAEAKLWFHDPRQFAAAPAWSPDDIVLTCDDDIVYPEDYVARHTAALEARPRTLSCVHGAIVVEPFERYGRDRMVCRMYERMAAPARVHIPGTGTMAFRRRDLDLDLRRDIRWSHCVDIMMARIANAQGLECWMIDRRASWLQPLPLPGRGAGIYRTRTGAGNDQYETEAMQAGSPWPVLPVPLEFRSGLARP